MTQNDSQDKTFLTWYNSNSSKRIVESYTTDMVGKTGSGLTVIETAKHYNGSRPTAFGGAKEWPCINVHISLPVETSHEDITSLLRDLRELLNKHGYQHA